MSGERPAPYLVAFVVLLATAIALPAGFFAVAVLATVATALFTAVGGVRGR